MSAHISHLWRLGVAFGALATACEATRLDLRWPDALSDYDSALLVVDVAAQPSAISIDSPDAPFLLSLGDEVAPGDSLWLLLYERPPSALGLGAGRFVVPPSNPPCELARPSLVFRASLDSEATSFEPSDTGALPEEVVRRHLAPRDAGCTPVDCRLHARWLASTSAGALVRVFPHPEGRALLVDRTRGLIGLELESGHAEPLPVQPELPLLDARLHAGELFVLSQSGRVWRGPVEGPFRAAGASLPEDAANPSHGGLAVGGEAPELYTTVARANGEAFELELYRHHPERIDALHGATVRARLGGADKLSFEWLGPGHVAGVYGGDRIVELRDQEVRMDGPAPTKDLVGGIPLDLLAMLERHDGGLFVTGHEGSLWSGPGPRGPWTERRSTVASGVGIGVVGLAELGDGVVLTDLNSGAAFVHDERGLCFDGVMERVYVTAAGRVGERVVAGGFGQLGVVERTWR